jgi:hypothetical protein
VICYTYLWAREHGGGTKEGAKDRPCAIVAARQVIARREVVTVVPITHAAPVDPADAVELPPALKVYVGLDDWPSWIIVADTNDFFWPGPDLRPRRCMKPTRFDYGMLPPRFFAHVRDLILQAHRQRKLIRIPRPE